MRGEHTRGSGLPSFPKTLIVHFWLLVTPAARTRALEPRRRGTPEPHHRPNTTLPREKHARSVPARETEREPHSDTAAVHTHARSGRHHGHTSTDGSGCLATPAERPHQPRPGPACPSPSPSSISPSYPPPYREPSYLFFFYSDSPLPLAHAVTSWASALRQLRDSDRPRDEHQGSNNNANCIDNENAKGLEANLETII